MAVCLATSVTEPKGSPAGEADVFRQLQEQGADFLLTVKANQKTLYRQIQSQFQGKRHIPFLATDHEISHGRDISWTLRAKQAPEHIREAWSGTSLIVEVIATGSRDGKPFQATHPPGLLHTAHLSVRHQPSHHPRSLAATCARSLEH